MLQWRDDSLLFRDQHYDQSAMFQLARQVSLAGWGSRFEILAH
jgi:hypothetical protein